MTKNLPLKCLMIEDKETDREYFKSYILSQMTDSLILIAEADNVREGKKLLDSNEIDLIFLDLEMSDNINGVDFLLMLNHNPKTPPIVVISGHANFVLESTTYDVELILRKPLSFSTFKRKMMPVIEKILASPAPLMEKTPENEVLFFDLTYYDTKKRERKELKVEAKNFMYATIDQNEASIFLSDNTNVKVWLSLVELEKMISPAHCCRIHRDTLLGNKEFVEEFFPKNKPKPYILLKNGKILEIGDTYKKELIRYLQ